ncbi:AAA family ATPase [Paenibacillus wenxiniae]|uniref:MoxR family ATPase n=1 Tax=Paenibacillus wenxiniae TaxID=1636843 RepID=A0ABW4RKD8_9BACL
MNINHVQQLAERLEQGIGQRIVGKTREVRMLLTALLASGHVLMEDVPGTGKTLLARTLAQSVQCRFQRIQFTPDLLPSDLTGGYFYNQKESEFIFRAGPLFAHIVLADEINRATPRTQSSLLECMEERQISIDGESHRLEDPFMVIATQNPVDNQGTFPLPEAQMDRFMLKLSLGYPTRDEGVEVLRRTLGGGLERSESDRLVNRLDTDRSSESNIHASTKSTDTVHTTTGAAVSSSERTSDHFTNTDRTISHSTSVSSAPVTRQEIMEARRLCREVRVHDDLLHYVVRIAEATRQHQDTALGASPRATQALLRAAQAYAAIHGRDYVLPDDVQALAVPILAHRIVFRSRQRGGSEAGRELLEAVLAAEPVPAEPNIVSGAR